MEIAMIILLLLVIFYELALRDKCKQETPSKFVYYTIWLHGLRTAMVVLFLMWIVIKLDQIAKLLGG